MSNLGKKSLIQLKAELEDLKDQQFELSEVGNDLKTQTEEFEKKIQSLLPTSSEQERSELKLQIDGNRAAIQPIALKIDSIMARLGNVGKALRRHSSAPSQSKMSQHQMNLEDTESPQNCANVRDPRENLCDSFPRCFECAGDIDKIPQQASRPTVEASCDSLNKCNRCAEAVDGAQPKVTHLASKDASQKIFLPLQAAMSCQSIECEDCMEFNNVTKDEPARSTWKKLSQRNLQQRQIETPCDSLGDCQNCANIHNTGEVSCDSLKPIASKIDSIMARLGNVGKALRRHSSASSTSRMSQRQVNLEDTESRQNCANVCNPRGNSCHSFNKCFECADDMDEIPHQASRPLSRMTSRRRMLVQSPEAMSCQSIGNCEGCAKLYNMRSDLRPMRSEARKPSRRSLQQHQLDAPCDSLGDCQNCAILHNTGETSCDSLNECNRCSEAVDEAQLKVTRLASKVASQKVLLPHQAAMSCQSIECEDCMAKDPMPARLAWRKLSQRILQQSQLEAELEASCDSLVDCQNCANIHNTREASCDSLNECNRCAEAVDGAQPKVTRLASKVASQKILLPHQAAVSCQSIGKCEDCTKLRDGADDIEASQRISKPCQLDPSCDSFGACQDCANICNIGATSCDSLNVCSRCKDAIDGIKNASQKRVTITCPTAMSCQSIGACEDCSELCREARVESKPAARSTQSKTGQKKQPMKNKTLVVGRQQPSFAPSSSSSLTNASGGSVDKCGGSRKRPTPGRTLLRLKRPAEFNNLDCPSNPCESLEKAKIDRKRRVMKKTPPPKKHITPIQELPEDECVPKDECATHKKVESKCDGRSDIDYSKKYLKMRYEIELQNYLIDKMNRELQKKILKGRPEMELCTLNEQVAMESQKLRRMVQFAIVMQRCDRDGKWGPIPISAVGEPHERKSRSCPRESTRSTEPPQTPSDITLVSGFEQLEEIMLNDDKECCMADLELKLKEEKIQEFSRKIDEMSAELEKAHRERVKMSADGVGCEQLFDMKTASVAIGQILGQVEQMQLYIKKLQEDFHEYKSKAVE